MLRRLHPDQPDSFAFTPANQEWAEAQITKYPEGRQASAIIPLLWRAQEQEGWLTRAAIEHVSEMLGMAPPSRMSCRLTDVFRGKKSNALARVPTRRWRRSAKTITKT